MKITKWLIPMLVFVFVLAMPLSVNAQELDYDTNLVIEKCKEYDLTQYNQFRDSHRYMLVAQRSNGMWYVLFFDDGDIGSPTGTTTVYGYGYILDTYKYVSSVNTEGKMDVNPSNYTFKYSEIDIYNGGNLVFQAPLQTLTLKQTVMMLTEGVQEILPQMSGTMSIVVLCGVGCLALLIGCVVLKKVLFRFL